MTEITNRPGLLGEASFGANGTAEFQYRPRAGHTLSVFFTNADQPGTVELFRVGRDGALHSIGSAALVAGTEDRQEVAYPVNHVLVRFTNTNATPGRITCEAIDGGQA